ncbi:MAG: flagellar biosynthesis anti-sigma factor FlgM [Anaerolineae bacterium]|nr:flagellar biosynthesis anti-sigma factor FlgM [Anaerolineae bacterium]
MIDKIQSNLSTGYTNSVNQVSKSQLGISDDANRVSSTSAEVKLSNNALVLQRGIQAVKDAPDVRPDIVNAIKQQLEAGTYQVDVASLAKNLLPFMK